MCEPPPGPMCATHARRALDRADRRYRAATAEHARAATIARNAVAERDRIKAEAQAAGLPLRAHQDATEGDWTTGVGQQELADLVLSGAEDDVHTAHADLAATREALTQARRRLAGAQRDYDVTPAGIDALRAAADAAATRTDTARALARLTWARERAVAIQHAWKRSSVYTEQRIARTRSEETLSTLRRELTARRCSEHGVVAPPHTPRARTAWEASPDGTLWARVTEQVGPTADLTFMLPQVRDAATPREVETVHWAHVPPRWVPTTTIAWMARARATQQAWAPTAGMLVEAVQASGEARTARRGAFVAARRADTWHVAEITGPLRVPDVDLTVHEGWVAVRGRDAIVRVLDDLDRFHAPA